MIRKPFFVSVYGQVQNVMFRQTIIRACIKRDIDAGATNNTDDKSRVDITFFGEESKVNDILSKLKSGEAINSWGARVTKVEINDEGIPPFSHSINTMNVDSVNWNPNVEFYI